MASAKILKFESQTLQPWKNGRGATRQIAIWPSESDFRKAEFDWRISTARVTESGPFSRFQNYDRTLLLLDGEGLEIRRTAPESAESSSRSLPIFANGVNLGLKGAKVLKPNFFDPIQFSGDDEVEGRLTLGAVTDFNVFTKRDALCSKTRVLELPANGRVPLRPVGIHWLLFAAAGDFTIKLSADFELEPGDALLVTSSSAGSSAKSSAKSSSSPSASSQLGFSSIVRSRGGGRAILVELHDKLHQF